MIMTTTMTVDGYRVARYLGIVRGIIVRAPTISQGIMGGLKSVIGGRIGAYTDMCEQARRQAYEQLIDHAIEIGANAVISVSYEGSEVAAGAVEVMAYGTAVVLEPA